MGITIERIGVFNPIRRGAGVSNLFALEGQILGPLAELNGDGIGRALVEEVLGRAHDVKVAEANAVISGAAMGISLARAGDRDLAGGCLEVDAADDLAVPVGIIHAEIEGMEFHGGGWKPLAIWGHRSIQAPQPAAERFIGNDHTTGIGFIPLPDAVHAGVDAGPAVDAVFLVDGDAVLRKGLALFLDLLVKPCPDHLEEPGKFGASFDFLDELGDLLDREIDVLGQIFLQVIEEAFVFQVDLAFLVAPAAVDAESRGAGPSRARASSFRGPS